METYIKDCIKSKTVKNIDEYIDNWHNSESNEELYQYLGMTQEEYHIWVEDDDKLTEIVNKYLNGIC